MPIPQHPTDSSPPPSSGSRVPSSTDRHQIGKRLVAAGLTNDAETRRGYREVLIAHPQLGDWLAGVILFEETLGQANADGVPFPEVRCNGVGVACVSADRRHASCTWK